MEETEDATDMPDGLAHVKVVLLLVALVLEGLAGEEVDGARNDALLEVLADLVVKLELLVELLELLLVNVSLLELLHRRRGRRGEEVEERVLSDDLLDDTRLVGSLVALLLDLDRLGEVFVGLPLDLVTSGALVDKVTSVANLGGEQKITSGRSVQSGRAMGGQYRQGFASANGHAPPPGSSRSSRASRSRRSRWGQSGR